MTDVYFEKWWDENVGSTIVSEEVLKKVKFSVAENLKETINEVEKLKKHLQLAYKKNGDLNFIYWLCRNIKFMKKLGLAERPSHSEVFELLGSLQTHLDVAETLSHKGLRHISSIIKQMNEVPTDKGLAKQLPKSIDNLKCYKEYGATFRKIKQTLEVINKRLENTLGESTKLFAKILYDEENVGPDGDAFLNRIEISYPLLQYYYKTTRWITSAGKVSHRPSVSQLRDFFLIILTEHFRERTCKPHTSLAWDVAHIFITPTTKKKLKDGKYESKGHLAVAAINKCEERDWDVKSIYQRVKQIYSQPLKSP